MSEEQKKITVKLRKGGWEVEITCSVDEVEKTVKAVLSSIPEAAIQTETLHQEKRGAVTCKSIIEGLWREGYFLEERTLSDVDLELSRRGYHYDKTAVSHTLTDLVREGILTRLGNMRNYRYVQKKPP
ncbi:MAG: hypothetical protein QXW32_07195 [Nitrososphaerales archaeon]